MDVGPCPDKGRPMTDASGAEGRLARIRESQVGVVQPDETILFLLAEVDRLTVERDEANATVADAVMLHQGTIKERDALRADLAAWQRRAESLSEVGNWMAECLEDSLVNLAEWEHSPNEDALEAWRVLVPEPGPTTTEGEAGR